MKRTEQAQSEDLERALADAQATTAQGQSELSPLIELAVEVRDGLTPPAPSAAFSAAARTRLLNHWARSAPAAVRHARRPVRGPRRVWQPALAGLIALALLLGGSLGVAYAAGDAMPGDVLYRAKRGLERLQLVLTSSPDSQASLRARFASERLREAEAVLATGRESEANGLLAEYQSEIAIAVGLLSQSSDPERVHGLQQALAAQQQALNRFLERSSGAGGQAAGEAAMEEARHSQAVLETLLQGGNPSDQAPGQLRRTESPVPRNDHGRGQGQGGGRWRRTPTPEAP